MPAICTLWRRRKSCSRKGSDCNQRQQLLAGTNAATNEQAFITGSVVTGRSTKNRRSSRPKPDAPKLSQMVCGCDAGEPDH